MIVRKATIEDAIALRGRLRQQDYDEVWAAYGHNPDDVLVACARFSTMLWCAEKGEAIVAVFGVAPSIDELGVGQPWLLGADEICSDPRVFFRWPKQILLLMHRAFPVLRNRVDARNTRSICWLRRMGFTIEDTSVPYGPFNMPFYVFYKEERVCVPSWG
ncbi:hypothetical protein [Halodesulfovibrio marinisediminis]|uniref:N-acetyltransferase domain-containing protein n=1 Tax=Halodesulfovibrio marinisediminis DSM 17456 TaxID=1121457 RepID=A0A1N6IXS2_9BACT|nr:hypothetical protein [Halodesulfovibrio marinisediminis]SIO36878.1 hypothetical protein SAMN02745161_3040 [Halodesulfovibrio marinisediminis DSM 17456]